jgi:hypothetical protein
MSLKNLIPQLVAECRLASEVMSEFGTFETGQSIFLQAADMLESLLIVNDLQIKRIGEFEAELSRLTKLCGEQNNSPKSNKEKISMFSSCPRCGISMYCGNPWDLAVDYKCQDPLCTRNNEKDVSIMEDVAREVQIERIRKEHKAEMSDLLDRVVKLEANTKEQRYRDAVLDQITIIEEGTSMTDDLVETIKSEAVNSEIDRHLAGRIITALMAAEARTEALTALVREADCLIGADEAGWEWKRNYSEFRTKASVAKRVGKDTP